LRVHFLNLDRSSERLAEFRHMNGHLTDAVRFPAVDGQKLDIAALAARGLVAKNVLDSYRVGAVGHAMSNLAIWDMAINTGKPVTICHDDAIFNRQFEQRADELMKSLQSNWDFVLWGWNFDSIFCFEMLPGVSNGYMLFEEAKMAANTQPFQEQTVFPRPFKLIMAWGVPCYTVSARGAQAIRSKVLPFQPLTISRPRRFLQPGMPDTFLVRGIDGALNSIYPQINAFVCFPPLVITRNEQAKSTIQRAAVGHPPVAAPQAPRADDSAAFIKRAMELEKLGRFEEASAQYGKALGSRPGDSAALSGRAGVLIELGRFEAALADCDKLLSLRGDDLNALNMRGLALEGLKRFEEALVSYDRAIAIAPAGVEALYNRGNILADLERSAEALASYDRALAVKPDAVAVLNNRGLVLEALNRFDEALASYDKALAVKPDYNAAADNRRLVLEQLGRAKTSP